MLNIILEPIANFLNIRSFVSTRSEIKKGTYLFEWTPERLLKEGVMGPWKFNLYESFLAGIPAVVVWWLINLIVPLPPVNQTNVILWLFDLFVSPSPINQISQISVEVDRIHQIFMNLFLPFYPPLTLTIMVLIVGLVSKTRHREEFRKAYLYFDGSYGLLPQTWISLSITLYSVFGDLLASNPENTIIRKAQIFILVLFLVFLGWNLYIILVRIPELLFRVSRFEVAGSIGKRAIRGVPTILLHQTNRKWIILVILIGSVLAVALYFLLYLVALSFSEAIVHIKSGIT